ncbi:B2 bradykinin receptor-like [Centroberyx affinis]|uniref:B2 bradykinin receptor-like n=1 Tax=Centroberyx affinis TaxID=166261 RepID=UPI003A5C6716
MTLQPARFPVNFTTTAIYGDQNNTNGSGCPHTWHWLETMQPVYILAISVLGILGNVFVLLVFCLHKKACTVAEIYLGNLAAADLVLVSCLPFWAVNVANNFNWPFGVFMCRLVNLGIKMNVYCSIYFLVLVSIDRYVALVHTMSHGRMRRPKYAKLACLLVWGFGLLLGVPTFIFRTIKYFPPCKSNVCQLDYPSDTIKLVCDGMLTFFSFIIPVSIISYCTIKIIQALKKQAVERFNAENTERKATLLVLAVLLAFLICWVPFHLVAILDVLQRAGFLKGSDIIIALDICTQIFTYLAFFNSVLNPILYVIVGKNFRKKVRELFEQLAMRRKMSTRSQRSSTLKTSARTRHLDDCPRH